MGGMTLLAAVVDGDAVGDAVAAVLLASGHVCAVTFISFREFGSDFSCDGPTTRFRIFCCRGGRPDADGQIRTRKITSAQRRTRWTTRGRRFGLENLYKSPIGVQGMTENDR